MKVLDEKEKEIFESLKIPFVFVDCMNVPVPESWKKIRVATFEGVKE